MTQIAREQWDAGRFFQTLGYFGVIPFVGSFKCLQQLAGGKLMPPITEPQPTGVVLVAGATGGVGKRVVQRLVQRGYPVRALVRNAERGREILGHLADTTVELVEADLTRPETLTPAVLNQIRAIICCTGTRVQPVGDDTRPDATETPEYVEYRGIQNLVDAAKPHLARMSPEAVIFNFKQTSQAIEDIWGVVDDVVMGGVSQSSMRLTPDGAVFSGTVSTANSGGFVSVRTRDLDSPLDLSGYEGIELRVKGDGDRYKFILRSENKWDGVGYCASFDTVYNIPISIRIPFADLIPVFRAKTLKDYPPFDASHVTSFQLMLSKFEYDGELNPVFKPGAFQLQVESIKAYGGDKRPQFVMVSSAGVTRPGKPGLNLEEEPPAVRMNDRLGGILTWKLRGEESVRSSGIPYTIVRPCALTEEPGGNILMSDRGDTIKGQCSREDIAELCVRAIELSQASYLTFEVKESFDRANQRQDWTRFFGEMERDRPQSPD